MSKRTAQAAKRIRLIKLMEFNNELSPDVPTATITVNSRLGACTIAELYFGVVQDPFPFGGFPTWAKSTTLPVELYFPFKRRKDLFKFVRRVNKEFPELEVIT